VICPDAAQGPLGTLAVHGLLHLLGYDHEVDAGEMLALQDTLLAEVAP
jgi:ssRNA-specific RNase YbeY (16S rRNA maturation enzyme)